MFDGFFSGKRILITGNTGFKGSWLSLWLQRLGADILGFSLDAPQDSLFLQAGLDRTVKTVFGDLRDPEAVNRAVADFRPEIVIHMAAQALVRRSYRDPVETFGSNVMGTVHLLDAIRRSGGVRAVINVTSDKCYENREWVWGYRENDAMGGHDPYSASKGCAELAAQAFARSYFHEGETALASVRAGNVIGGGDMAEDRLIPDMVRAFARGDEVRIRSPHATRPWQHVLEPLCGYLMLARRLFEDGREFAGGWNFGPADSDARTVGEVVSRFSTIWGEGARHTLDTGNHPHEAHYLKLDCSKVSRLLGWKPGTDFATAVEWTADWYRRHHAGEDAATLCAEQIETFEALP